MAASPAYGKKGLKVRDVDKDHFSSGVKDEPTFSRLVIRFLEGKSLLASDIETGKSDPVAFVWVGSNEDTPDLSSAEEAESGILKTRVCPTTVDPIWNEDVIFPMDVSEIDQLLDLKCLIYVRDEDIEEDGSTSYDELGMVEFSMKHLITKGKAMKNSIVESARWYSLKKSPGMRKVDGTVKLTISLMFGSEDNEVIEQQVDMPALNGGHSTNFTRTSMAQLNSIAQKVQRHFVNPLGSGGKDGMGKDPRLRLSLSGLPRPSSAASARSTSRSSLGSIAQIAPMVRKRPSTAPSNRDDDDKHRDKEKSKNKAPPKAGRRYASAVDSSDDYDHHLLDDVIPEDGSNSSSHAKKEGEEGEGDDDEKEESVVVKEDVGKSFDAETQELIVVKSNGSKPSKRDPSKTVDDIRVEVGGYDMEELLKSGAVDGGDEGVIEDFVRLGVDRVMETMDNGDVDFFDSAQEVAEAVAKNLKRSAYKLARGSSIRALQGAEELVENAVENAEELLEEAEEMLEKRSVVKALKDKFKSIVTPVAKTTEAPSKIAGLAAEESQKHLQTLTNGELNGDNAFLDQMLERGPMMGDESLNELPAVAEKTVVVDEAGNAESSNLKEEDPTAAAAPAANANVNANANTNASASANASVNTPSNDIEANPELAVPHDDAVNSSTVDGVAPSEVPPPPIAAAEDEPEVTTRRADAGAPTGGPNDNTIGDNGNGNGNGADAATTTAARAAVQGSATAVVRALKEMVIQRKIMEESLQKIAKATSNGFSKLSDRIAHIEKTMENTPDTSTSTGRDSYDNYLERGPSGGGDEDLPEDYYNSDADDHQQHEKNRNSKSKLHNTTPARMQNSSNNSSTGSSPKKGHKTSKSSSSTAAGAADKHTKKALSNQGDRVVGKAASLAQARAAARAARNKKQHQHQPFSSFEDAEPNNRNTGGSLGSRSPLQKSRQTHAMSEPPMQLMYKGADGRVAAARVDNNGTVAATPENEYLLGSPNKRGEDAGGYVSHNHFIRGSHDSGGGGGDLNLQNQQHYNSNNDYSRTSNHDVGNSNNKYPLNHDFNQVLERGSLEDVARLLQSTAPQPEQLSASVRNRLYDAIATLLQQNSTHTERCLIWILSLVRGRHGKQLLNEVVGHTKRDIKESLELVAREPSKRGLLASLLKSQLANS